MFEICNWGFYVNDYVPVKRLGTFPTFEAARAAVAIEWADRDRQRKYTDMGTFKIRPVRED